MRAFLEELESLEENNQLPAFKSQIMLINQVSAVPQLLTSLKNHFKNSEEQLKQGGIYDLVIKILDDTRKTKIYDPKDNEWTIGKVMQIMNEKYNLEKEIELKKTERANKDLFIKSILDAIPRDYKANSEFIEVFFQPEHYVENYPIINDKIRDLGYCIENPKTFKSLLIYGTYIKGTRKIDKEAPLGSPVRKVTANPID